jgi:cyclopropane-fatty-acyl-phospholipid synthase
MDRLLHAILKRLIKLGALTVTNASGLTTEYGDGTGSRVAVRFTSRAWQRAVIFDPEMCLGEAYMERGLVVDHGSIADLLDIVVKNAAACEPTYWSRMLRRLRTFVRNVRAINNPIRASRNARHHYNIDHRIYRLFLDSDMQYSCAYFERPDATLEEAQQAKKRHIAAKLVLDQPDLKVLDIGSGWGGLGLHLARFHDAQVVGINLSDEQVKIARDRAKAEGLPCEFRIQDYRHVGETFDRIVSVGMFEHVGKRYYDAFFSKCFEALAKDGVMLLHTVGRWDVPSITNPWVWRYIFPGGYAPTLSEITPAIERSGFIIADVEVLRLHYAETLRHWRDRFLAHRSEALNIFDERFVRMWEFYLAGFEFCFRYYGLNVFQIQLVKRLDAVPITRNHIYRGENRWVPSAQVAEAAE